MPLIKYRDKKFSAERAEVINQANAIIADYKEQGFDLTLRQLFYQFVSRDLIPNKQKEYDRLGEIISDARLAGLVDWDAIVDRTRQLRGLSHWKNPAEIVKVVSEQFRIDKWADQPNRIEVWIEKDALVGVIEGICTELDVPYFSCRGYTSQSEMWGAAMRLRSYVKAKQMPIIIHLGDHDPSGIDMTRDITDRLCEFAFCKIEVVRIALNFDQVQQYNPPPNPCKLTDSRATGYISKHGQESWELDALEPRVIASLIQNEVFAYRDVRKWKAALAKEDQMRKDLTACSEKWPEVCKFLHEAD